MCKGQARGREPPDERPAKGQRVCHIPGLRGHLGGPAEGEAVHQQSHIVTGRTRWGPHPEGQVFSGKDGGRPAF